METPERAIVVGLHVGMIPIPAEVKGLILLKMEYKMFAEDVEPDDIPEESLTFVLTPNQLAGLLHDLTKPLLELLPRQDDE